MLSTFSVIKSNLFIISFSEYEKYGRLFLKQPKEVYIEKIDKVITRNAWTKVEPKVFSKDKSQLDFLRTIGK